MRIIARRQVFALLRWSGLPFLIRQMLQRGRTTILFYHDVDAETLDLHLSVLGRFYNLVSLRDYVDARLRPGSSGLPSRPLVITFDDGLRSQYALLDVFRKHAVTPTIFLCSGIVGTNRRFWWTVPGSQQEVERLKLLPDEERLAVLASLGYTTSSDYPQRSALSLTEVAEMRDRVDFQAHTVTHPILPSCTDDSAWAEISDCRLSLEENLGLTVYALAYPNGDHSTRELEYAAKAGYTCAVGTQLGFNDAATDIFALSRIGIPAEADANEAIVRATGLATFMKRLIEGGRRAGA